MKKLIYVDNAATTKISKPVFESMIPFLENDFGNPSSLYSIAKDARKAMEKSRQVIADCINARSDEIFFTSCGTESDNWALKSSVKLGQPGHIITSQIEHHAVLESVHFLERNGINVSYLKPDKFGIIHPETLEKEIKSDTNLVSIMMSNNEIGSIQPL